jgi:hypothetical protein
LAVQHLACGTHPAPGCKLGAKVQGALAISRSLGHARGRRYVVPPNCRKEGLPTPDRRWPKGTRHKAAYIQKDLVFSDSSRPGSREINAVAIQTTSNSPSAQSLPQELLRRRPSKNRFWPWPKWLRCRSSCAPPTDFWGAVSQQQPHRPAASSSQRPSTKHTKARGPA